MKKQHRAILQFMIDFHRVNDVYPTIREICKAVAISSTSVGKYNLARLEALGYIMSRPGRARCFSPTAKAFTALGMSHTNCSLLDDEMDGLHREVQRLQMQIDSLKRLHQAQITAYEKEREWLVGELSRLQR